MINKDMTKTTLAAGAVALAANQAEAAANSPAVNEAINLLKTYDWGDDRNALNPIDQAINATHGDRVARRKLEKGLVDVLAGGISRSAQDYVCRKLRVIGTGQSIDALAALLPDEKTSHIARYALTRIPGEKAATAMRDALPKASSALKAGIVGSLGTRRDRKSTRAIAKLLRDADPQVAQAAAHALGLIGTPAAAKALSRFAKSAPANLQLPVADASLICADTLLAGGKKTEAVALYTELKGEGQPKQVKVAAMKGMLTAATKK